MRLNVEHGSFTPLVFSCLGGMYVECSQFYNKVADKISEKRDISISKRLMAENGRARPIFAKSYLGNRLRFFNSVHLGLCGTYPT